MIHLLMAGGSTTRRLVRFPRESTGCATHLRSDLIEAKPYVFKYLEYLWLRVTNLYKPTTCRTKEKIFSHKSCNQS